MRAELVAIHTALTRCKDHSWIGVFTDSLSNLQAIRLHSYRPGLAIAPHYHHHMLLLHSISNILEDRREKGFSTTLRKIRAHTHIRGNDLADATTKLSVTDFDTLTLDQTMRVEIGAIAPRHPFLVLYMARPPPPPHAHTGPRHKAETSYPPPFMVDNPGSEPLINARFPAPLTSTETKSQGRDPPKHVPHFHLQETHYTSQTSRGNHCYHRDGTPRPSPGRLKRRHKTPQIHLRATIQ